MITLVFANPRLKSLTDWFETRDKISLSDRVRLHFYPEHSRNRREYSWFCFELSRDLVDDHCIVTDSDAIMNEFRILLKAKGIFSPKDFHVIVFDTSIRYDLDFDEDGRTSNYWPPYLSHFQEQMRRLL